MKTKDGLELLFLMLVMSVSCFLIGYMQQIEYQTVPWTRACISRTWVETYRYSSDYFAVINEGTVYKLSNVQIYGQLQPGKCYETKFYWGSMVEAHEIKE
jgi:hypothetical protein